MKTSADQFFDADLDRRLQCPTDAGSALPNPAYTDPDYHLLEQATLFRQTWVFAGFAHQVPAVGDVLPVTVGGQPLLLVRSEDNTVRAFHNVCRHRGAKLVDEARRRCRTLVCPNHSWSYGLDGQLMARPHFFGGDRHDVNHEPGHRADLAAVACETWHDWVFVNIDGIAGPLADHLEPVVKRLGGYDFGTLRHAGSLEFDLKANWKLAIENFIEPYHVFSCHPWLNSFVGMTEREPPEFEGHVLRCGYSFAQTDPARGGELPWFPELPKDKTDRGDWYVLFPNFAFEVFPDQVDVFVALPEAVDRTREVIALYFIGDAADGEQYASARNHVIENWRSLNQEDIGIIERMQAGRHSEGFDGGVLSPYWDPVQQHFARLVVDAVRR